MSSNWNRISFINNSNSRCVAANSIAVLSAGGSNPLCWRLNSVFPLAHHVSGNFLFHGFFLSDSTARRDWWKLRQHPFLLPFPSHVLYLQTLQTYFERINLHQEFLQDLGSSESLVHVVVHSKLVVGYPDRWSRLSCLLEEHLAQHHSSAKRSQLLNYWSHWRSTDDRLIKIRKMYWLTMRCSSPQLHSSMHTTTEV